MSEDTDVDPAELEAQLEQIKDAMGLYERYEGAAGQWLLFGVLVLVAAAASQYVHLEELPGYWHGIIWIGLLFGGGFLGFWLLDDQSSLGTPAGKPGIWFIFVVTCLTSLPIGLITSRFVEDLGYQAEAVFTQSIILVFVGLAYLVTANALRAYHIRARDRYAFYVGGIMLIGLGAAMPYVDILWTWGYAVFGTLYFAYAIVTYLVLSRT